MRTPREPLESPFLRQHSGLARAIGAWDVFIFNLGLVSIGIGLAYTQRFATAYYPGGGIPAATVFAGLLMIPVALAMWSWTVAMPRSGGIYVFLTRSFHPALGFALSFAECVSWLFYAAMAAKLLVTVGLIPLIGLVDSFDAKLVVTLQKPIAQLFIGVVVIWASVALLISGTGRYLRVQRIVFVVALVGLAATVYALAKASPTATTTHLGELVACTGTDLAKQIDERAAAAGWIQAPSTLAASAALLVWPFLPLIGSVFSMSIGGEVRNNRRSQLLGMLGSLIVSVSVFAIVAMLAERGIGATLQGALGFLWDMAATKPGVLGTLRIKAEPWFPLLVGLTTSSVLLRILIGIGFIAWVYFWVPGVLAYCSRAMLAWSLDRAAPAWVGSLHSRFVTPWATYVLGGAVATIFLSLILYTDFFATLVFIQAAALAWCLALAFGSVFPWRRPELFSRTPVAAWRLGPLPWMAVLNFAGAVALGYAVYLMWNDSLAAGHSPKSLFSIGSTFAAGLLLYGVMARVRAKQGNPIVRAYREIPVE